MTMKAFQDYYADNFAHCYGCGRLNEHGLQIKSYWDGEESVCHFKPKPYHTGGFPGNVYGGIIASLIDCHGAGTASAAIHRYLGKELGAREPIRFVTASLHVDYLSPTPIDASLELRGRVKEIKGRKVIVAITLAARESVCATGEVVMVQLPDHFSSRNR
ncbi:MAG: PaaI family thioesterase [Desulfobacterales bacterium]|nr:MAG: PaaI family thioesterase [Desulfobacterales bacterium]